MCRLPTIIPQPDKHDLPRPRGRKIEGVQSPAGMLSTSSVRSQHLCNAIPSPISMLCQSCADFLPRSLVEECSFDHQIELLLSSFSTTCHLCKFLQDKFLPIEIGELTRDPTPSVKLLWMRNGASYKVVQARGQLPRYPPVDLRLVTAERALYHRQILPFLLTFCRARIIQK
jgi:hypothetical protein